MQFLMTQGAGMHQPETVASCGPRIEVSILGLFSDATSKADEVRSAREGVGGCRVVVVT